MLSVTASAQDRCQQEAMVHEQYLPLYKAREFFMEQARLATQRRALDSPDNSVVASSHSRSQAEAAASARVHRMMREARTRYETHPEHTEHVPTLADRTKPLDLYDHADYASRTSDHMLQQVSDQLTAPCVAPDELTSEEIEELEREEEWDRAYQNNETFIDHALMQDSDALFREVMGTIDDAERVKVDEARTARLLSLRPAKTAALDGQEGVSSGLEEKDKQRMLPPPEPSQAVAALRALRARSADRKLKKAGLWKKRGETLGLLSPMPIDGLLSC